MIFIIKWYYKMDVSEEKKSELSAKTDKIRFTSRREAIAAVNLAFSLIPEIDDAAITEASEGDFDLPPVGKFYRVSGPCNLQ